jgi:HemK-related putative methylase
MEIKTFCEMGAGSGYLSVILKKLFPSSELYAIDRNPDAVSLCQRNLLLNNISGTVIESNLFESLIVHNNKMKFDLIIFNPPYLPSKTIKDEVSSIDLALNGGFSGSSIIRQFLEQMHFFLSDEGLCFLIFSNFNNPFDVLRKYKLYKILKTFKQRLIFESIQCIVLTKI